MNKKKVSILYTENNVNPVLSIVSLLPGEMNFTLFKKQNKWWNPIELLSNVYTLNVLSDWQDIILNENHCIVRIVNHNTNNQNNLYQNKHTKKHHVQSYKKHI